MRRLLLALGILCLSVATAGARTWYITPNGAGDAPTIQAGIDSASAGDTVLVAAGTYYENITIKAGLCVISEFGPSETRIEGDPANWAVVQTDVWGAALSWRVSKLAAAISVWIGISTAR